jgi:hypothetical protein
MRISLPLLITTTFLVATAAMAATPTAVLTDVQGTALLKNDTGTTEASIGAVLTPGQEVIVGLTSSANIMMDNCAIVLAPGSRYQVPAAAPCARGETFEVGGVSITPANGEGAVGGFFANGTTMALTVATGLTLAGIVSYSVMTEEDEEEAISPP